MSGKKLAAAALSFLLFAGCGKIEDEPQTSVAAGEAVTPIVTETAVTDTESAPDADTDTEGAVTETGSSADSIEEEAVTESNSSETESAADESSEPETDSREAQTEAETGSVTEGFEESYTARFAERIVSGEFDVYKKVHFPDGYIGEESLAMYGGDIYYKCYMAHPADGEPQIEFEQLYMASAGMNCLIDRQEGYFYETPLDHLELPDNDILTFFGLSEVMEGGMDMTAGTDDGGRATESFDAGEDGRYVLTFDTATGMLVGAETHFFSDGEDHVMISEYDVFYDGEIEVSDISLPEYGSGKFRFREQWDLLWEILPPR